MKSIIQKIIENLVELFFQALEKKGKEYIERWIAAASVPCPEPAPDPHPVPDPVPTPDPVPVPDPHPDPSPEPAPTPVPDPAFPPNPATPQPEPVRRPFV
jgi:fused signal recognition particle receptor